MTRSPLSAKPPKPKMRACDICREKFIKRHMSHKLCGKAECGIKSAEQAIEKRIRAAARVERQVTRERKEKIKTRNEWIADVQVVFNRFVRERDIKAGHGCIDCGKPFEPSRPGGSVDAGHFLSRGSAPHLRFSENNCFAQRKNCNRPGGTTREAFRAGVEARIGREALEAMECDQASRDWTIDDLKAMKKLYQEKIKALK